MREIDRASSSFDIAGCRVATFGVFALAMIGSPSFGQSTTMPYETLRAAYAARDPALAAQSYAASATYTELHPGAPPLVRVGRSAIERGFADLFAMFSRHHPDAPLDLNFRRTMSLPVDGGSAEAGYFRLRIGHPNSAGSQSWYGSFAVRIQDDRFMTDTSGSATREDFESAAGPLLLSTNDELLDPAYYDALTATYRRETDGCHVIVTRSSRRLFAYDECSRTWRGLARESGRLWRGGTTVISESRNTEFAFALPSTDARTTLRITSPNNQSTLLERRDSVARRNVTISAVGGQLGATLYLPASATRERPAQAYVLVHGSGPQDRHGYASYIALLAIQLARHGVIALAYDKRGTGESTGDWASATFDDLAADSVAAMTFLRAVPEVDRSRIGLLGSSQAGWVTARAVANGAKPHRVVLIGAAGSAVNVEEQNLYNTRVRMRCSGLARSDIALALAQQRAFFAARRDPAQVAQLTRLSQTAQQHPHLRDWLFPATVTRGASPEWYDVLDLHFDPLAIWRDFDGESRFVFGALDDSTPTSVAVRKLAALPKHRNSMVQVLKNAQHLGLEAHEVCSSDLDKVSKFHPDFFPSVIRAAR